MTMICGTSNQDFFCLVIEEGDCDATLSCLLLLFNTEHKCSKTYLPSQFVVWLISLSNFPTRLSPARTPSEDR